MVAHVRIGSAFVSDWEQLTSHIPCYKPAHPASGRGLRAHPLQSMPWTLPWSRGRPVGPVAEEQTPLADDSGNAASTAAKNLQHRNPAGKENEDVGADHVAKRRKHAPASLRASHPDDTGRDPEQLQLRHHAAGARSAVCPAAPGPQHAEAYVQPHAHRTAPQPLVPLEPPEQPAEGQSQRWRVSKPAQHTVCQSISASQPPQAVCETALGCATA